jgi:hypothetical protein
VSLSNDEVQRVLNDQFICTWVNIKDDPAAGASFAHPPNDQAVELARGLGEHNNQILMLTPNGKIVNALAGFIGPADLLEELQFSVNLLGKLDKASDSKKEAEVTKAHKAVVERFETKKPSNQGFFGMMEQFGNFGMMQIGATRAASDHRWTASHPLMPVRSFTTGGMVGNGKSVFVSSVNGTPKEGIGNMGFGNFFGNGTPFGGGGSFGDMPDQARRMMDGFFGPTGGGQNQQRKP